MAMLPLSVRAQSELRIVVSIIFCVLKVCCWLAVAEPVEALRGAEGVFMFN